LPLGPWELAIILVIVIIIFGVGKLPQIGGALGQGIREFRTSAGSSDNENETTTTTTTTSGADSDRNNTERVTVVKESEES
jgi:sec-independent protein translocase protein TatA